MLGVQYEGQVPGASPRGTIQGCAGEVACSSHGVCSNAPTYKCTCSSGWCVARGIHARVVVGRGVALRVVESACHTYVTHSYTLYTTTHHAHHSSPLTYTQPITQGLVWTAPCGNARSTKHGSTYVDEHLYNIQCSEIFTLRNENLHTET
jgi:hypothetical protein